jgi:hypothetical protein
MTSFPVHRHKKKFITSAHTILGNKLNMMLRQRNLHEKASGYIRQFKHDGRQLYLIRVNEISNRLGVPYLQTRAYILSIGFKEHVGVFLDGMHPSEEVFTEDS